VKKGLDPLVQTPTSWYWDEPFFLGGSSGTVRDGLGLTSDSPGTDFKNNWGSPHRGGVVFAFCDGSVHAIAFPTDWNVLLSLLTPSGGESPPPL